MFDWTALKSQVAESPAPESADVGTSTAQVARAPEVAAALEQASGPRPAPARRQSLVEKYRPRRLADIVGQPEAVAELRGFLAAPRSKPLIFHGPTGTGKTSAAWAVAGEVGCDLDGWCGGVESISSGDHTADTLREKWPGLWTRPFSGSGMRVLIVNETEKLNDTVDRLWQDKLENMPPRCIIIFTTNDFAGLSRRLRGRCRPIQFHASASRLDAAARELIGRIWQGEAGGPCPPGVAERVIQASTSGGELSFREVVEGVERELELRAFATA